MTGLARKNLLFVMATMLNRKIPVKTNNGHKKSSSLDVPRKQILISKTDFLCAHKCAFAFFALEPESKVGLQLSILYNKPTNA
jgi:hypothetical protein